ncbi:3'-5' exonuclease [Propioniciclava flava]
MPGHLRLARGGSSQRHHVRHALSPWRRFTSSELCPHGESTFGATHPRRGERLVCPAAQRRGIAVGRHQHRSGRPATHPTRGHQGRHVRHLARRDGLDRRRYRCHPRCGSGPTLVSDTAVLARRNQHIRPLYGELLARGIPVEIVGLDGLLAVPEVADVVAVLRVLGDATANPDVVRILTGPRWAIGPTDLATLGRRTRELAGEVPPSPGARRSKRSRPSSTRPKQPRRRRWPRPSATWGRGPTPRPAASASRAVAESCPRCVPTWGHRSRIWCAG